MEAPVLNKSQRRRALKKKPSKKSVRNVLARPRTLTWPLLSEDECAVLKTKLTQLLQFQHQGRVKWDLLKYADREKRKELRNEIAKTMGKEDRPELLNSIIFGMNAVSRGIEKKIISSALISADVNPVDMVRHIWYGCHKSHIPVIAVPSLRSAMKQIVGFPVLIMALKPVPSGDPFSEIYELICEMDKKFTGRTYPFVETIELEDTFDEEIEVEIELDDVNEKNGSTPVLLYRSNSTKRCFTPPKSKGSGHVLNLDWNNDFIALSESMDLEETAEESSENKSLDKQNKQLINDYTEENSSEGLVRSIDKGSHLRKKGDMTLKPSGKMLSWSSSEMKQPKGNRIKRTGRKGKSRQVYYQSINLKRLRSNPKRKK